MKYTLILILLFLNAGIINGQNIPHHSANYELPSRFSPDKLDKMVFSLSVTPHWLKYSNRFWYEYETSSGKSWYIVDPVRQSKDFLFDNTKLAADMSRLTGDPFDAQNLDIENLKLINRETVLQFEVKSKLVEVQDEDEDDEEEDDMEEENEKENKTGDDKKMVAKTWYFEYTLQSGDLRLLNDFERPKKHRKWASIAPDSSYVLFARLHNLHWMDWENYLKARKDEKDTTIVETQLTTDGEEYYSYARFSRGENNVDKKKNFDKRKAVNVVWSADSEKFAMTRSDSRKVKDLWVINHSASPRPTLETYKYHMPGEKEAPQVELHVFDFATKNQIQVKLDAFKDQSISILQSPKKKSNVDDELTPNLWLSSENTRLYFTRTSRDLKRIDVCVADSESGEVKVIIEERLNTYIETRPLAIVNGGEEYIHWSERDGWAHFYLFDGQGKLKNQITSGAFHCESIEGIDSEQRVLYFRANGLEKGEDPYYYHLYKINFDGTGLQLLNAGNFDHLVSVNDDQSFFVDNYSRVNCTPASALYNNRGQKIVDLETADLSQLLASGYKFPEPFIAKAADGITDIYGVMYKPYDFDSTRKYPLIEYVYPGPQTEAVNKSFTFRRTNRTDRLAQFGFIVATMGNRGGHPARSKRYHNYGYGNLRDYGLADKKAVAEQLAYRHDFIDIDRVGIQGHSGGGFMSTAAMLIYPDFFKVAVSSAGNHENNIYNRWWSEKHHGVKEVADEEGKISFEYDIDKNSEIADNLKGRLLITTGDIDNNVHPANTIKLAQALIKANKRFDFFIFPGQRHGFGDMTEYFFWLRGDYFCKYLLGESENTVDIKQLNLQKQMSK